MKVYLVVRGCYDGEYTQGVYRTVEAAMAANPIPSEIRPRNLLRPGGWQPAGEGSWDNGLDWDDAGLITEFELEGETTRAKETG